MQKLGWWCEHSRQRENCARHEPKRVHFHATVQNIARGALVLGETLFDSRSLQNGLLTYYIRQHFPKIHLVCGPGREEMFANTGCASMFNCV